MFDGRSNGKKGKQGNDYQERIYDQQKTHRYEVGQRNSAWDHHKDRKNSWSATVTITVHDSGHTPVANVTVAGDWSGASFSGGSNTCITDGSGQCSVSTGNIRNDPSVTYTVTDLTGTGYTYDASANHVTSITLNR